MAKRNAGAQSGASRRARLLQVECSIDLVQHQVNQGDPGDGLSKIGVQGAEADRAMKQFAGLLREMGEAMHEARTECDRG